jgi:hypothetical protein
LFGELRALAANLIQLFLLQLEIFCHQGPVRSRASRRQQCLRYSVPSHTTTIL